jgi:hypothetical protein
MASKTLAVAEISGTYLGYEHLGYESGIIATGTTLV